jgi:hypothetical protein
MFQIDIPKEERQLMINSLKWKKLFKYNVGLLEYDNLIEDMLQEFDNISKVEDSYNKNMI